MRGAEECARGARVACHLHLKSKERVTRLWQAEITRSSELEGYPQGRAKTDPDARRKHGKWEIVVSVWVLLSRTLQGQRYSFGRQLSLAPSMRREFMVSLCMCKNYAAMLASRAAAHGRCFEAASTRRACILVQRARDRSWVVFSD